MPCARATVQHELGDGAKPGRALKTLLSEQDFILRTQDTMEGLGVEHHGIICFLEDSLWLVCAKQMGER